MIIAKKNALSKVSQTMPDAIREEADKEERKIQKMLQRAMEIVCAMMLEK